MKHLTLEERYLISSYLQAEKSVKFIAKKLNRHISTIYRELSRNSISSSYDPESANKTSSIRKKLSFKFIKLTDEIKATIQKYLKQYYSPEQIVGFCKKNSISMVSTERIYQYIWKNKRNNGALYKYLRSSSKKKKKRYGSKDSRGIIKDRVCISERPKIVDTKERVGDWEIDTVVGQEQSGYLVTVVERKTKFTVIGFSKDKKADNIANNIIKILSPYKEIVKTITADNGKEFAEHKLIAKKLNCNFYFAHPYHSWERGLNENTNGLIRQFLPKNYNFKNLKQKTIKKIQNLLNNRPRKTLAFEKPKNLIKLK